MSGKPSKMPSRSYSILALLALRTPMALEPFMDKGAILRLRESTPYQPAIPAESLEANLLEHIHNGEEERAIECLKRGANPKAEDEVGLSLLHHSAAAGMLALNGCLIDAGANVNALSIADESVLNYVILMNAEPPRYLPNGAMRERGDGQNNILPVVDQLLKRNADTNAADARARTPAMNTAEIGDIDVLDRLKKAYADFASRNYMGVDPTYLAAYGGHIKVVHRFQQWGIDPRNTIVDSMVMSARECAEARIVANGGDENYRYASTAQQLLRGEVIAEAREIAGLPIAGRDLTRVFNNPDAFRHVYDRAQTRSDYNAAAQALEFVGQMCGFEPLPMRGMELALFQALSEGRKSAFAAALEKRPDVSRTDQYGHTLAMVHVKVGGYSALPTLKSMGCDMNAQDCLLNSALHYAAEKLNIEGVRGLLAQGALPLTRNWKGQTPRDMMMADASTGPAKVFSGIVYDDDGNQAEPLPQPGMRAREAVSAMLRLAELHWEVAGRKEANFKAAQLPITRRVLH